MNIGCVTSPFWSTCATSWLHPSWRYQSWRRQSSSQSSPQARERLSRSRTLRRQTSWLPWLTSYRPILWRQQSSSCLRAARRQRPDPNSPRTSALSPSAQWAHSYATFLADLPEPTRDADPPAPCRVFCRECGTLCRARQSTCRQLTLNRVKFLRSRKHSAAHSHDHGCGTTILLGAAPTVVAQATRSRRSG